MAVYVRVRTEEQLRAVLKSKAADEVIIGFSLAKSVPGGSRVWLSLPDVLREENMDELDKLCLDREKFAGFEIQNMDEAGFLLEKGWTSGVLAGEAFYTYNSRAAELYRSLFPDIRFIAPAELTDEELNALEAAAATSFIYKIYGHQKLMTTAQVLDGAFTDEQGRSFTAVYDAALKVSYIFTGRPVSMLDKPNARTDRDILLDFTTESGCEVAGILKTMSVSGHIRGHHFKGID